MTDTLEAAVATDSAPRLKITEIFYSLQGESRSVGWPTSFVRLTGCPLRCGYCDTEYAFTGGDWMTLDDIIEQVASYPARHVTVTGGEPLAQKQCLPLLSRLADGGYHVSLETSGALDVSGVDPRVVKVMDLKTPASGEVARNRYDNLEYLSMRDQVKFVICNRQDYEWARSLMAERDLPSRCEVLLSPVHGDLLPADLAAWMLADGVNARFQLQLHKLLWGEEPGR